MNRFRAQGFLDEFPVLGEFARWNWGEEKNFSPIEKLAEATFIRIKRMDEAFLSSTPSIGEHTGSMVGIYQGNRIFLVALVDEKVKFCEVEHEYDFASNYAHTDPFRRDGETVLEAIDGWNLPLAEPVSAIEVEYGLEIRDHYSYGFGITLWKVPKNLKIADLIESAKAKALDIVRAEANF